MATGAAAAASAEDLHRVVSEGDTAPMPTTAAAPTTAASRWPQLIPLAQLLAVVLGVMAIIWNQQQSTENLRTEMRAEIASLRTEMRAEIAGLRTETQTEIKSLRAEIAELRAEVRSNGERLARIEGFLGIGIPEEANPP